MSRYDVAWMWQEVVRPLAMSGAFITLLLVTVFHKHLGKLLKFVALELPGGGVVKFGHSDVDTAAIETLPATSSWRHTKEELEGGAAIQAPEDLLNRIKWNNSANLFWLSHDLVWTMQAALRGASKTTIEHGLNHCSYHSWKLSLHASHPGRHIDKLAEDVAKLNEDDLDREWRKSFVQGMNNMIVDIGSIMMVHQPDFEWDVTPQKTKG